MHLYGQDYGQVKYDVSKENHSRIHPLTLTCLLMFHSYGCEPGQDLHCNNQNKIMISLVEIKDIFFTWTIFFLLN